MDDSFENLNVYNPDSAVTASIPEAFRLHGILECGLDLSSDEFSDDEDVLSDTISEEESGSDEEDEDDYDEEDDYDDEDEYDDSDHEEGRYATYSPLIRVRISDVLVRQVRTSQSVPDTCVNGIFRSGMWATDPKLPAADAKMGFLSQLAQICVRSKLYHCNNTRCIEKRKAMEKWTPQCDWQNFREWALVAMSCQAAMDDAQKLSRAHTHLARAAAGCFNILKRCLEEEEEDEEEEGTLNQFLDGESSTECRIELAQVFNLIYWMVGIQSQIGTGPAEIWKWNHHFLPFKHTIGTVQKAAEAVEKLHLCKNRLWNLVNISDRKHSDLPDIVTAIASHEGFVGHKGHETCTPSKCQEAQINTTKVEQLHKCKPKTGAECSVHCSQKLFPIELLETNLELGRSTAWLCKCPRLCSGSEPYIAISHVWSDGTGAGLKKAGSVNSCLFQFFASLAEDLGCKALWWDTLSVPSEPKARNKALNIMHSNYADAKHTIVHDSDLLEFPWSEDGGPCIALVLSTWFTRGWTALELAMSKNVKVLFKNPKGGKPVIKDLDQDVLARSPRDASRAHWLATALIQRLRRPIDDVGDLVAILTPRCTSWARDRTIIASLLAGVPDADFSKSETDITKDVLQHLGKIPYFSLLHGKPTISDRGRYSWSTATLEDLPVEAHGGFRGSGNADMNSVLEIDDLGAVWGIWAISELFEDDVVDKNIEPYGDDLAATLKVQLALTDWRRCLLLQPSANNRDPKALLVAPIAVLKDGPTLKCRYIGTVRDGKMFIRDWSEHNVQIGGQDDDQKPLWALDLVEKMDSINQNTKFNDNNEMEIKDPDNENFTSQTPSSMAYRGNWLTEGRFEELSSWSEKPDIEETSYPADLTPKSLNKALQAKNKSAARFLVKRGVRIAPRDVKFNMNYNYIGIGQNKNGKFNERLARGLTLLGDVYLENSQIAEAINTYMTVLHSPWAKSGNCTKSVALLHVQFSLGQTFMEHRREILNETNVNRILEPSQCVEEARKLFQKVLNECKKRGNYRTVEIKKKLELPAAAKKADETLRRRQLYSMSESVNGRTNKASKEERPSVCTTVDRQGEERKGAKWLELELNTVAELLALSASCYDFTTATTTYKQAMRHFGDTPEVLEGFKLQWAERRTQNAQLKKERDEAAASVYQRALKRFSSMFKKRHLLILITKLHLGINYIFRSKFKEAETNLNETLLGLIGHTQLSPESSKMKNPLTAVSNNCILVVLARYYLGYAYLEQERFQHAYRELNEALKIAPSEQPECIELRNSISLALCKYYLNRDDPHPPTAITLALSVIQVYRTQAPHCESNMRLILEAQLNLIRALHKTGNQECIENAFVIGKHVLDSVRSLGLFTQEDDMDKAELKSTIAFMYEQDGVSDETIALRNNICDVYKNLEGCRSVPYLKATAMLSGTYLMFKEVKKAEEKLREALSGFEPTLGEYATRTLKTCQELGLLYLDQREMEMAKKHCEKAFRGFQKRYGTSYGETAQAAYVLGTVYFQSCKFTQAREMFLTSYNGFMGVFRRRPKFHKMISLATINLADSCAALGGPMYEAEAENYYNQALSDLREHCPRNKSQDEFRVILKQGELFRQRNQFDEAELHIMKAYNHFIGFNSTEVDVHFATEHFEVMLRLGELRLSNPRIDSASEVNLENPETLIRMAKEGLMQKAGDKHPLTLRAAVLLGEICLKDDCQNSCPGEQQLSHAVWLCERGLPDGSPMTIKAMDCLINHWAKYENTDEKITKEINLMRKRKWEALEKGYGLDTAIAIMKMTDPKRENPAIWNIQPSNPDDGGESTLELDSLASEPDIEDLESWGQGQEHDEPEQRYMVDKLYMVNLQSMINDGQNVMQQPPSSGVRYDHQPQCDHEPQNNPDFPYSQGLQYPGSQYVQGPQYGHQPRYYPQSSYDHEPRWTWGPHYSLPYRNSQQLQYSYSQPPWPIEQPRYNPHPHQDRGIPGSFMGPPFHPMNGFPNGFHPSFW